MRDAGPRVALLAAGHGLAMVDRHLLAVAAPVAAASLGLSDGMLGFALGPAFAIAFAAAALPLGRLADRGGRRRLLAGGALLWSAASAVTGLGGTAAALIAARVAMGVGQAAFVPAALATLVDGGPASGRAARLAVFTSGSTLGRSAAALCGGLVLAALADWEGAGAWRLLFVLTALPNLLLIAGLLASRDVAASGRGEERETGGATPLAAVAFLLVAVAPLIAGQAGAGWMPTLLVRTQGLSPAGAGVLIGAVTVMAAPSGQLLGGTLGRRWRVMQRRPALVAAAGLWASLPLLLLVVTAATPTVAAIRIAGLNLTLGVASFAGLFGWQTLIPPGARGVGNALFMAVVTLAGAGAGPLLTGLISQAGGSGGAALGHALLAVSAASAVLASAAAIGGAMLRSRVVAA